MSVDGVDDDAEMVDMIQWVESEGIRVERAEGEITFSRAIEKMEEILAEEKRAAEQRADEDLAAEIASLR